MQVITGKGQDYKCRYILDYYRLPYTCQIIGCDSLTTTIVYLEPWENPTKGPLYIGVCEEHHQKAKKDAEEGKDIEWLIGLPTRILVS